MAGNGGIIGPPNTVNPAQAEKITGITATGTFTTQPQTTTVTVSGGTSLEDRTGNFWIGGDDDLSFWFDGKIGPTRIWNNWLTDDQVLQNYNSQKARFGL